MNQDRQLIDSLHQLPFTLTISNWSCCSFEVAIHTWSLGMKCWLYFLVYIYLPTNLMRHDETWWDFEIFKTTVPCPESFPIAPSGSSSKLNLAQGSQTRLQMKHILGRNGGNRRWIWSSEDTSHNGLSGSLLRSARLSSRNTGTICNWSTLKRCRQDLDRFLTSRHCPQPRGVRQRPMDVRWRNRSAFRNL